MCFFFRCFSLLFYVLFKIYTICSASFLSDDICMVHTTLHTFSYWTTHGHGIRMLRSADIVSHESRYWQQGWPTKYQSPIVGSSQEDVSRFIGLTAKACNQRSLIIAKKVSLHHFLFGQKWNASRHYILFFLLIFFSSFAADENNRPINIVGNSVYLTLIQFCRSDVCRKIPFQSKLKRIKNRIKSKKLYSGSNSTI